MAAIVGAMRVPEAGLVESITEVTRGTYTLLYIYIYTRPFLRLNAAKKDLFHLHPICQGPWELGKELWFNRTQKPNEN